MTNDTDISQVTKLSVKLFMENICLASLRSIPSKVSGPVQYLKEGPQYLFVPDKRSDLGNPETLKRLAYLENTLATLRAPYRLRQDSE